MYINFDEQTNTVQVDCVSQGEFNKAYNKIIESCQSENYSIETLLKVGWTFRVRTQPYINAEDYITKLLTEQK